MSGPPSFLAVLLLCAAAAEAVSAGRGRLVRSEAQLGTVSAVVQPDGAVVGRGHAAAAVPKADDPEDADDAELTEDSGAEEMLMEDGLVGLSKSAVGAVKVCAKKDGDNCTCQGIMAWGTNTSFYRSLNRVDGTETCSSDPSFRRRRSQRSDKELLSDKKYTCLCFDMDKCKEIAKANNKTIDAAHRRRRSFFRSRGAPSGRRRGTGLAQRRRWCGLGGGGLPDCKFEDWGDWSKCQEAAGNAYGIQLRLRSLKEPGQKDCDGDLDEIKSCSRRRRGLRSR